MVPVAFFQFQNSISVNLFTGLLLPILGETKNDTGSRRQRLSGLNIPTKNMAYTSQN